MSCTSLELISDTSIAPANLASQVNANDFCGSSCDVMLGLSHWSVCGLADGQINGRGRGGRIEDRMQAHYDCWIVCAQGYPFFQSDEAAVGGRRKRGCYKWRKSVVPMSADNPQEVDDSVEPVPYGFWFGYLSHYACQTKCLHDEQCESFTFHYTREGGHAGRGLCYFSEEAMPEDPTDVGTPYFVSGPAKCDFDDDPAQNLIFSVLRVEVLTPALAFVGFLSVCTIILRKIWSLGGKEYVQVKDLGSTI